MDWQFRVNRLRRHIVRPVGGAIAVGSVALLGAIGIEAPSAEATIGERLRTRAATPIESVSADAGELVSFNLFELLGNIFRYVQVSNISDAEEIQIGRRINRQLLNQQYELYNNNRVQSYVERIGQRLVDASDSRDIPFKFQVVESEAVNAFAIPGGYVYVTTGLLRAVENEAQLASVLAHEISHINKRHSVEALKRATLAQGIAETANVETSRLAQIGYQVAIELPRSRDFEYAADEGGLEILRQAGYPTIAFVNFLEILESSSATPEFLRTHPTSANRIEELRNQIAANDYEGDRGRQESTYENRVSPLDGR